MQTYWIYYNGQPVTAVRLPFKSSDTSIRAAACQQSAILCNRPYEAPFEFELKVQWGEIRIFA